VLSAADAAEAGLGGELEPELGGGLPGSGAEDSDDDDFDDSEAGDFEGDEGSLDADE